jgi:hypothetical protein
VVLQHDHVIDVGSHDELAAAGWIGHPGPNLGHGLVHAERIDLDAE